MQNLPGEFFNLRGRNLPWSHPQSSEHFHAWTIGSVGVVTGGESKKGLELKAKFKIRMSDGWNEMKI